MTWSQDRPIFLIILLLVMHSTSIPQIANMSIPQNTVQISVSGANSTLLLNLIWNGTDNLDLFLYRQGQNLMSEGDSTCKGVSTDEGKEEKACEGLAAGSYFARVVNRADSLRGKAYALEILEDGSSIKNYTGEAHHQENYKAIYYNFRSELFKNNGKCGVNVARTDGEGDGRLTFVSPKDVSFYNPISDSSSSFSRALSPDGNWTLFYSHPFTSTQSIIPVTFTITYNSSFSSSCELEERKTQPPPDPDPDPPDPDENNSKIKSGSKPNLRLILGIVFGGSLILVFAICIVKKSRTNSEGNMKEMETCTKCGKKLSDNEEAIDGIYFDCKHNFHKECLSNKHKCPECPEYDDSSSNS